MKKVFSNFAFPAIIIVLISGWVLSDRNVAFGADNVSQEQAMTGADPSVNSEAVPVSSDVPVPDLGKKSPASPASVLTREVTNITGDSAEGNGELTSAGGEDPIRFIDWGRTSGVYDSGSCNVSTGGTGPYSCTLIGLLPNTKYYARAKAMNSAGTVYGKEVVFVTTAQKNSIRAISKKILENPVVKSSSVVVESAGLAAGASGAAATGALPVVPLSPTPLSDVVSRLFGLFGIFSRAKKKNKWGTVFDSETRRPISGAVVSIINSDGKVVDAMTTNMDGKFGFLASKGEYSFRISKDDYELSTQDKTDEFYGELYDGKTFSIEEEEVAEMNIALKAINIDWQDFAKRRIAIYGAFISVVKKDVFSVVFYAGFIISAGVFFISPSIFGGVMIVLYLAMIVRNIFFKTKKYGLITSEEGNPIPFAMISLYEEDQPEKRITFAVSDIIGRYFVLAENRRYLMKIQGREPEGRSFKKLLNIDVKDGVFKKDVFVNETDYLKNS